MVSVKRFGAALLVVCVLLLCVAGSALASAQWRIDSLSNSTVAPGGELTYHVQVSNLGGDTDGSEIQVRARLDPSLVGVSGSIHVFGVGDVPCKAGDGSSPVAGASEVLCSTNGPVFSAQDSGGVNYIELTLTVKDEPGPGETVTSGFSVTGGGDAGASTVDPTRVSATLPGFGFDALDGLTSADQAGDPVTQAGSHPYSSSVSIDFNTENNPQPMDGDLWPVQSVKDVFTELPPGLVGDTVGIPRCTLGQLSNGADTTALPLCPVGSQVGVSMLRFNGYPGGFKSVFGPVPVFNMVPPAGMPAEFGFNVLGSVVVLGTQVRTGGDYGITVTARNISQALAVAGSTVTLWDVPSDPSHDEERACPDSNPPFVGGPTCPNTAPARAFLRAPTSCTAPGEGLTTTALIDSWAEPGAQNENAEPQPGDPRWQKASFTTHEAPGYPYPRGQQGAPVGLTGCDKVPFTPSVSSQPTSTTADGPTGLKVAVSLPQDAITEPEQVSQSDVKKVVMTLPEGMTVNPSQANGLAACSQAQIALTSTTTPSCPLASKIGAVTIKTPLLEDQLQGAVYLAAQNQNPFGTLLAIYIVAQGDGVTLKLPGRVDLNPATGRLTVTVDDIPQQPFSLSTIELEGGSHGPLIQPSSCGSKTIVTELTGWNGKVVTLPSSYEVPCTPGLGSFAPSFAAGTTNNVAGSYSPMTLAFGRDDGEQELAGLTETLAPGLLAKLAGVARCGDAEAATGNCPVASRIGSVTVAAGAGESPVALHGTVYLTGPYGGGPFGAAVVVPAVAGPFDLGNVVVRASIRIDRRTAQASIVSDSFPRFVGSTGIPTDIRRVEVNLDRPGFALNPTDCEPLQITGKLTGSGGASANVSSRFQAAECGALGFAPKFTASTSRKVSRNNGASLTVKVAYPQGAEANIRSVKVKLPKQLASRLSTLQQACTAETFAANPAACPAGSLVGSARAVSPILAAPLTGPAYFVSHGGAKFPELTIVLQGEGVTIELDGETLIDEKTNITSSTFRNVPDAPVSSFALTLPSGPHSALGSRANLCKVKLAMPTIITAQDGAVVKQNTKIAVGGCPKARHHKRKKAKKRKR